MGRMENGSAGGFINPTGFHPNKPVLDNIDPAYAVFASMFIQCGKEFCRAHPFAIYSDRIPGLKCDFKEIKGKADDGFVAPMAVGALASLENDQDGIAQYRAMYRERLYLLGDLLVTIQAVN